MDVDTIQPGENFVDAIETAVSSCDVLIALIGSKWLSITDDDGNRRLDNPHDFVRVEITAALKRGIRVIPVLLAGTMMPKAQDLPVELQLLTELNALEIRHGSFDAGIEKLQIAIDTCLREIRAADGTPIQRLPAWAWIAAASSLLVIVIAIIFLGVFLPKLTEATTPTTEEAKQVVVKDTSTPPMIPSSSTPGVEIQTTDMIPTSNETIANTPTPKPTATFAEISATATRTPTETPTALSPTEIPPEPSATPDLPYGDLITLHRKESYIYHDPNSNGVKMSKLYYDDTDGTYPVSMQDFIVEAVFYNPYGTDEGFWDFGFMFRDTSQSGNPNEKGFSQARIVITNQVPGQESTAAEGQGYWFFYDNPDGFQNNLDQGPLSNLDTSKGGANRLILMVKGPYGEVYLNGELIGKLDLSSRNQRGSVWVAISFQYNHEKQGAMTPIKEIRLWNIKPES